MPRDDVGRRSKTMKFRTIKRSLIGLNQDLSQEIIPTLRERNTLQNLPVKRRKCRRRSLHVLQDGEIPEPRRFKGGRRQAILRCKQNLCNRNTLSGKFSRRPLDDARENRNITPVRWRRCKTHDRAAGTQDTQYRSLISTGRRLHRPECSGRGIPGTERPQKRLRLGWTGPQQRCRGL